MGRPIPMVGFHTAVKKETESSHGLIAAILPGFLAWKTCFLFWPAAYARAYTDESRRQDHAYGRGRRPHRDVPRRPARRDGARLDPFADGEHYERERTGVALGRRMILLCARYKQTYPLLRTTQAGEGTPHQPGPGTHFCSGPYSVSMIPWSPVTIGPRLRMS